MKLLKKTVTTTLVLGCASVFSHIPALASEGCGDVTVAEMNWTSAGVLAQIDRVILESGYGCSVELVPGDTGPTFASMSEKGQPDIAPEIWVHSVKRKLDEAVAAGRIMIAGHPLKDGAQEGWWVPHYIAEQHNIQSVEDALARPDLFPGAEDSSKGALFNCPAGWNCQIITENYFRAYDAGSKGFELVDSGSGAGLDGSIARAFERKEGWLGYYWSPTAMLGKYKMTLLDGNVPFSEEEYKNCSSVVNCPNPKINGWGPSEIDTLVSARFAKKEKTALEYFKKRSWTSATASSLMAWMTDNQANNEDGAYYFLENYSEVWEKWVPVDVAKKIKAAL